MEKNLELSPVALAYGISGDILSIRGDALGHAGVPSRVLFCVFYEKMIPKLYEKNAKKRERAIDHILPINVGGMHRKNNIRIICKKCNLKRPKDGKDIKQDNSVQKAIKINGASN